MKLLNLNPRQQKFQIFVETLCGFRFVLKFGTQFRKNNDIPRNLFDTTNKETWRATI